MTKRKADDLLPTMESFLRTGEFQRMLTWKKESNLKSIVMFLRVFQHQIDNSKLICNATEHDCVLFRFIGYMMKIYNIQYHNMKIDRHIVNWFTRDCELLTELLALLIKTGMKIEHFDCHEHHENKLNLLFQFLQDYGDKTKVALDESPAWNLLYYLRTRSDLFPFPKEFLTNFLNYSPNLAPWMLPHMFTIVTSLTQAEKNMTQSDVAINRIFALMQKDTTTCQKYIAFFGNNFDMDYYFDGWKALDLPHEDTFMNDIGMVHIMRKYFELQRSLRCDVVADYLIKLLPLTIVLLIHEFNARPLIINAK